MTTETRRGASGVRQAGDKYQHLVAWGRILSMLPTFRGLEAVEIEALEAGNADDVVIRSRTEANRFAQIKFGTDNANPISLDYLTAAKPKGTSILQKFAQTWAQLGGAETHPRLQLISNKNAADDAFMRSIDGKTSTVANAIATATSKSELGRIRTQLCDHLQLNEEELTAFFSDLDFRLGWQWLDQHEQAAVLMEAAGLRADDAAVGAGVELVQSWVVDGKRALSADEVRNEISALGLQTEEPWSTLLIQGIDHDPNSGDADVALDWVDFYDGDSAKTRRNVAGGAYTKMHGELVGAASLLRGRGDTRIMVRGAMRLATWFAAGEALAEVTGLTVQCGQSKQRWASDERRERVALDVSSTNIGAGDELAIAIAFATDPTPDVLDFVSGAEIPVAAVVRVAPHDGARVGSSEEANAYAHAIKEAAREHVRSSRASRVHLFLAAPAGLALLTGHVWNRVAPTTLWEDLGGARYVAAFNIDA